MQTQIASNTAKMICKRSEVFQMWLKLTKEMHELSDSEIVLAAKFLEKRAELKDRIIDDELLDEYLMSTKMKNTIKDECGIDKQSNFQNMITSLRKKGFLIEGSKISKSYIPNITKDSEFFKLSFVIKIDNNG